MPNEIPVVSHKGSKCDYQDRFEGQFECTGENNEK